MSEFSFSLETTDIEEASKLLRIFLDMYGEYVRIATAGRGKNKIWYLHYLPKNKEIKLPSFF